MCHWCFYHILTSSVWFSNRTERQLTTARANQTIGLTNACAANWAPEVEFSPFRALSRRQMTFPFWTDLRQHIIYWFVLYIDQKSIKNDTHSPIVPLDCSRIFFLSPKCFFLSRFFFSSLSWLYSWSFFETFFNFFTRSRQNDGENILQNSEPLVAMTHDCNCCEDFLQFRHSQVVKNSFCLRFSIFLLCY